jgi:DNA invertase Pin-like site-specific DNA recombinase
MRHEPADPQLAAIYCRMSEDREGGGLGVDRQREDCEQLAAQLGLTVVRVYADNDLSAYSGKTRPDYQHMLEALRAGAYGTVLAWHTDRLHRSPTELEEYIDVCEPRGVQTRTVKAGTLDLTTATGRMIARQLGVQARYEVERMIERQRRARDQKVQRGEWSGGPRPYGWEADGVTPVASEIAVIRDVAEAILAGASVRSIAADLNARGLRTSTGAEWDGGNLVRMLKRSRNAGILQHRGEEAGPAAWKAALDEPTWRSLRAVLDDPSRIPTASNVRKHLGSGLYLCGVCGEGLTSFSKGEGKPAKYKCRKNNCVLRDLVLLDKWVKAYLLRRLKRPDAAEFFTARQEESTVDVRAAQEDLRAARDNLDQLAAAFGAGEIDMQEWRVARESARVRKAKAEAVLASAVTVNPLAGLLAAEDVEAAWGAMDLSKQRAAVDFAMVVRVFPAKVGRQPGGAYWDPNAVRIEWKK